MANKRMFSNVVIESDRFLDLPAMAQLLYFHCGMKTDDDGFVSGARRIARIIGATEQDFQALTNSGFMIEFPDSKVFVITHHRQNNELKNDRYHPTDYQQEYEQLVISPNKVYQLKQAVSNTDTECIQTVSNSDTEPIVTLRNPISVTHESGGKGSGEGEPDLSGLFLDACKAQGIAPERAQILIDKFGTRKALEALCMWEQSGQSAEQFYKLIEMEEEK